MTEPFVWTLRCPFPTFIPPDAFSFSVPTSPTSAEPDPLTPHTFSPGLTFTILSASNCGALKISHFADTMIPHHASRPVAYAHAILSLDVL